MKVKALVEITSGIVRVGPDMTAFGKEFDFAAAFVASEGEAEVKALLSNPDMVFSMEHFRAGYAALRALGLNVHWQRVIGHRNK